LDDLLDLEVATSSQEEEEEVDSIPIDKKEKTRG